MAGNVTVGKHRYPTCLLFNSGCLPSPRRHPEKNGDMSRTIDSRVGRAAPRADGATKADAAAMMVHGFAGTSAVAIGPTWPTPFRCAPPQRSSRARAIGAPVHGISTPRSAPWWVAGLADWGGDTAASGDVPACSAGWRGRRARTPHRSSSPPSRRQLRSRGQRSLPASEYGRSSPDGHQHPSLPQPKE
jgi:hypothetical protein